MLLIHLLLVRDLVVAMLVLTIMMLLWFSCLTQMIGLHACTFLFVLACCSCCCSLSLLQLLTVDVAAEFLLCCFRCRCFFISHVIGQWQISTPFALAASIVALALDSMPVLQQARKYAGESAPLASRYTTRKQVVRVGCHFLSRTDSPGQPTTHEVDVICCCPRQEYASSAETGCFSHQHALTGD